MMSTPLVVSGEKVLKPGYTMELPVFEKINPIKSTPWGPPSRHDYQK